MLNGRSVLAIRKLLHSVTDEQWIKVIRHSNIDKFVVNILTVAIVVITARFSSFYVVKQLQDFQIQWAKSLK